MCGRGRGREGREAVDARALCGGGWWGTVVVLKKVCLDAERCRPMLSSEKLVWGKSARGPLQRFE